MQRRLQPVVEETEKFHVEVETLWANLPQPASRRSMVVHGYCLLVRQHVFGQVVLARAGLDVPATTLVRPAFESLVRAIWCSRAANESWIARFVTPNPDAVQSDGETEMGPNVQRMLDQIEAKEPSHIHQSLLELKRETWRAMHSFVHGGIRPVIQSLARFPEHEVAGVIMNANLMLVVATNLVRMNSGVPSPQLPALQMRYAGCLPPSSRRPESD
ncbi:DUF6988 family protein [Arenimonas oryziterrae]|uniref:DUF6988 family protein n=1 Tax=Arenimonas oryziterrae TaxID=498055 RepID=UPI0026D2D70C